MDDLPSYVIVIYDAGNLSWIRPQSGGHLRQLGIIGDERCYVRERREIGHHDFEIRIQDREREHVESVWERCRSDRRERVQWWDLKPI